jgi:radical SAM-linked protein
MNRLLFEKTGDAVYLSHLDLMRVFQRAFRRADILIWHSQGYSPRAYVSIALPLPVGTESVCEILDFEVEDGTVEMEKLPGLLNRTLPKGIRVLKAYESTRKTKYLTRLRAEVTLEYDGGIPQDARERIAELFSRPSVTVEKHGKKGPTEADIRPMLFELEIAEKSRQELLMTVLAAAQNPCLNPQLLVTAIETYLPAFKPDFARIRRMEIFADDGNVFR